MTRIDVLYHWSPKDLRATILREGLRVMMRRRAADNPVTGAKEFPEFPWICCSTSPSGAWSLIPDPDDEEGGWDLWEIRTAGRDRLNVRADFGPKLREVRVENSIPADRCWWMGERLKWPHDNP